MGQTPLYGTAVNVPDYSEVSGVVLYSQLQLHALYPTSYMCGINRNLSNVDILGRAEHFLVSEVS